MTAISLYLDRFHPRVITSGETQFEDESTSELVFGLLPQLVPVRALISYAL
jgi:hypothetical protein